MAKAKNTIKNKSKVKEIVLIAVIFIVIFSAAFFSIFKILDKKATTDYNSIDFKKKISGSTTYYEATFKDTYGKDFTFNFMNNPYDIEDIAIKGKVELKNSTIIFTDPIDSCENYLDNAMGVTIFLFKTIKSTSAEARSISGFNFSNYSLSTSSFIFVKKTNQFGQARIDKTDSGYNIYVKNCEIEKSFERFILAAYLNKQNITLTNQKI